ncbi:MAG: DUF3240 family protein [Pseudomonadota bacterium]
MNERATTLADGTLVLVTLVVSPAVSDAVIDWLLQQSMIQGFSSHEGMGHGHDPQQLTVTEQVAGCRPRTFFSAILPHTALAPFLEGLRADLAGMQVHYWATPVLAHGRLDDVDSSPSAGP